MYKNLRSIELHANEIIRGANVLFLALNSYIPPTGTPQFIYKDLTYDFIEIICFA